MKKSTKVKMGVAGTSLLLAIGTLDAFWASTGGVSPTDGKVLYGINRDSGQLFRYDFDTQSPSNVGVITDADGSTMTGIDASASIPGHQNIYGFWTDPDQGLVHLVYINSESATGTPVGDDLGRGHITGAVAAKTEYFSSDVDDDDDHDDHGDDHDDDDDDDDGDDDDHDRGHGNDDDGVDDDNPGHSSGVNEHGQGHGAHDGDDDDDDHDDHAADDDDDDHDEHGDDDDDEDDDDDHDRARAEFSLGWSIFAVQTREADLDNDDDDHGDDDDDDDDHEDDDDDEDDDHDDDDHDRGHGNDDDGVDDDNPGHSSGVNEHGQDHGAHDGDGDDDHADDDGHDNDDHADHDDDDHDEHGDDDDHEDDDDHDDDDDDDDDHESASATGYRLIQVDHRSGEVTEMMTLSREYDGLATTDGMTFMGTSGSDLYRIDPIARTETLVGSTGLDELFGLEFTDSTLIGFENVGDRLLPVDMTTGSQLGSPMNIGTTNLGTIIFMDASADPANNSDSYD